VGFWIEKGELTYPVEEITIAGNLKEMLLGSELVGNDLTFRSSVIAPTLKIRRMTVAGHYCTQMGKSSVSKKGAQEIR